MEKTNYTTLAATKLYSGDVSISVDPDDKNWYRLDEGEQFLVGIGLKICGAVLDDGEDSDLYNDTEALMEQDGLEELCVISGTLILAENMSMEDYDAYEVCDNHSADLEFVYSILTENNLDYDEEAVKTRNILYIDNISWDKKLDVRTKTHILNQLKGFGIKLYHSLIDAICFYSAPIEGYERESILSDEKSKMLVDKIGGKLINNENENEESNNKVINFSQYVDYSAEEINEHLGRRNERETYPEEFINREEYDEFYNLGFSEIGDTRLFIKFI